MSLVLHLPLNSTRRDMARGNHGTLRGSATYTNGKLGKCLDVVRGTNNHLEIPHNEFLSERVFGKSTTMSYSFWVNLRQFTSYGVIIGKQTSGSWSNTTSGVWVHSGGLRFIHGVNTSGNAANSISYVETNAIPLNTWTHVACVSNETTMWLYINGNLVGSTTINITARSENTAPIIIGGPRVVDTNEGIDGQISDLRIYDHALSLKEIKDLQRGLVTRITFDGLNDDRAHDSSPFRLTCNNFGVTKALNPTTGQYAGQFNGGQYLESINTQYTPGSMTLATWVYFDQASSGNQFVIGGKWHQSRSWLLDVYAGNVRWSIRGGGNTTSTVCQTTLPRQQWVHVTGTYDSVTGNLKIYLDGVLKNTVSSGQFALESPDLKLQIGRKGDSAGVMWTGMIDLFEIYNTLLDDADVEDLYRNGMSIADTGEVFTDSIQESNIINPNMLDYMTWEGDAAGSTTGFSANQTVSDENFRVQDVDPFGRTVTVWEARPDAASGGDGGWNASHVAADITKMYRLSVWIRRTVIGNGSTYFGTGGGTSALRQRSNDAQNSNPYFWSGGWGRPAGEWVLIVGHIWPVGSGAGAEHPDSGMYTVNGRISDINTDFVFDAATTTFNHRAYLYYSTNTATRQQFLYPRVDVVDGTEPSIGALLGGMDSLNYEHQKNVLGSTSVDDKVTPSRSGLKASQVSEVGYMDDSLVVYVPHQNDFKAYVHNKTVNPSQKVVTLDTLDGITGSDYNGTGSSATVYPMGSVGDQGNNYSVSAWVYPKDLSGLQIFNGNGLPYMAATGTSALFSYRDSGGSQKTLSGGTLTVNTWNHICATLDSTGAKLYVNGVYVSSLSSTVQSYNPDNLYIGDHSGNNYPFNGLVAMVKYFASTLSPEAIAIDAKQGKALLNKNNTYAKEFIEV